MTRSTLHLVWNYLHRQSTVQRILMLLHVFMPTILFMVLFYLLLQVVYYGDRSSSIAGSIEAYLITMALKDEGAVPESSGKVVIVSLAENDLDTVKQATSSQLRDADITEYAHVLEKVLLMNPSHVVLNWLSLAHPPTLSYYEPVFKVLRRLDPSRKTVIAMAPGVLNTFPKSVQEEFHFVFSGYCSTGVNLYCREIPSRNSIVQWLIRTLWPVKLPNHISANLPSDTPAFLLNLPSRKKLQELTFLDFRPPLTAEVASDATVFIGNDVPQNLYFRQSQDVIQKSYILRSREHRSFASDGLPFHVFWGLLAQMFASELTIAIAPSWVTNCATVAICLFSVCMMLLFGFLSMTSVVMLIGLLPTLNRIGVAYWHVYVPCFDMLFFGCLTFVGSTFLAMSINMFHNLWLTVEEQNALFSSDLKANFISMMSHNFNTPLAQMKGLLEVWIFKTFQGQRSNSETRAENILEWIHFCIRTTFLTMLLEDGSREHRTTERNLINFKKTWGALAEEIFPLWQHLNILSEVNGEEKELENLFFARTLVDEKMFSWLVAVQGIYFAKRTQWKKFDCFYHAIETQQGIQLTFRFVSTPRITDRVTEEFVLTGDQWYFIKNLAEHFMERASTFLLALGVKTQGGFTKGGDLAEKDHPGDDQTVSYLLPASP